jgi:penicillin-binding protein 1A
MRKKNAGALFMDFHVSEDDRVGATPKRKTRGRPAPAAKKLAKGQRIEPGFAGDVLEIDEERAPKRGRTSSAKARPAKSKRSRGRREKKPLTLFGVIWKLFSWLFILGIWAGVAAAGIIIYYAVQLPSSDT